MSVSRVEAEADGRTNLGGRFALQFHRHELGQAVDFQVEQARATKPLDEHNFGRDALIRQMK